MNLQSQDRIVVMTSAGNGAPKDDQVLYVVCADLKRGIVHALTPSGNSRTVAFDDIQDVEKCISPVTLVVNESTWKAHGCDPAYLGKPVRAICAMLSSSGEFAGLHIPKWPGSRPSELLTLDCQPNQIGLPLETILSKLPTNRGSRYHDPARSRNRIQRTAELRISKFVMDCLRTASIVPPPLDPSLHRRGNMVPSPSSK